MTGTKVVEFEKRNGNLVLKLIDRDELLEIKSRRDSGDWTFDQAEGEMLEWYLANGWSRLAPEDIGALTSCSVILTDEGERDEDGELTKVGRVYWHPNYMVEDMIDSLLENGEFALTGVED